MYRKILQVLLFVMLTFLVSCTDQAEETKATTVYLVRHAEKDLTDTTNNPSLTEEGKERAQHLVEEFNGIEVSKFYSTKYDRNINTVKPLADARSLTIEIYPWTKWEPMIDDIKSSDGGVYIICGHGDNILPMIEALGGDRPQESLGKHEYDNIFKVVISDDGVQVTTKKY